MDQHSHLGKLCFDEVGMYWCSSSRGFYDLGIGIKLLHVIIISCVPPLEECVDMLTGIHHGPCPLKIKFHTSDNIPHEIKYLDRILHIVELIVPLG